MKVKVNVDFYDIHTGEFHREGDVWEITESRLKEIQSVSDEYVTVIEKRRRKNDGIKTTEIK